MLKWINGTVRNLRPIDHWLITNSRENAPSLQPSRRLLVARQFLLIIRHTPARSLRINGVILYKTLLVYRDVLIGTVGLVVGRPYYRSRLWHSMSSVCLSVVCRLWRFVFWRNGWTDLREIFREGVEWPWEDLITFWVNSDKPRDAAMLISLSATLRENGWTDLHERTTAFA